MSRRKTTIGKGAFGRPVNSEFHEWDVVNRIIREQLPLSEDAVFILLAYMLKRKNQSVILKCVRASKNTGNSSYFSFSPDIDLLEIRNNNIVIGYELKGVTKSKGGYNSPAYYAGFDEALSYLINPISAPTSNQRNLGSIFDYVYLVHPASPSDYTNAKFQKLLETQTPIGLIKVNHSGTKEIVKPKRNPFVNEELKKLFLDNLSVFNAAFGYRLSLFQK